MGNAIETSGQKAARLVEKYQEILNVLARVQRGESLTATFKDVANKHKKQYKIIKKLDTISIPNTPIPIQNRSVCYAFLHPLSYPCNSRKRSDSTCQSNLNNIKSITNQKGR